VGDLPEPIEEIIMKDAVLHVVTDLRLMAVCVVLSQVIAIVGTVL